MTNNYEWIQPAANPRNAIGVRKDFGDIRGHQTFVGSKATNEGSWKTGSGIGERLVLRARVKGVDWPWPFSVAVGHAPPDRAPNARAAFMKVFAEVRAKFKAGDLNLPRRLAARALGRRVFGEGVIWFAMPRRRWKVLSVRKVRTGGDHKAIYIRAMHTHKKSGRVVTFLVINCMSASATKIKSSEVFRAGLRFGADIVMAVETDDFSVLQQERQFNAEAS